MTGTIAARSHSRCDARKSRFHLFANPGGDATVFESRQGLQQSADRRIDLEGGLGTDERMVRTGGKPETITLPVLDTAGAVVARPGRARRSRSQDRWGSFGMRKCAGLFDPISNRRTRCASSNAAARSPNVQEYVPCPAMLTMTSRSDAERFGWRS